MELRKLKKLGIEMAMYRIEPRQSPVNHQQGHLSQLPVARELLIDRGPDSKSRGLEGPLNLVAATVKTAISAPCLRSLEGGNPCPSNGRLPFGVKEGVLLVIGNHKLACSGRVLAICSHELGGLFPTNDRLVA